MVDLVSAFEVGLFALLGGGLYVLANKLLQTGLYTSALEHLGYAFATGFFYALLFGLGVPVNALGYGSVVAVGYFGTDLLPAIISKLPTSVSSKT